MIDTKESTSLVLSRAFTPVSINVALENAQNEILLEDLKADREFPPYDRVAMDGIALHTDEWEKGKKSFRVMGVQASGVAPILSSDEKECIEIMTGASLPPQYNAVIRYEDVEISEGIAKISNPDLLPKQYLNVHRKGSDNAVGDTLVTRGLKLLSPQIGIAASIGNTELKVAKKPVVSILATGDELVPVADTPLPHQVRISNAYTIKAAVASVGVSEIKIHHINDSKPELKKRVGEVLKSSDVVILSGGVSRGKFDFIPEILTELGVEKIFHKVKQKPGKPIWFGEVKSKDQPKIVFGLPGNPVSSVINCYKYILPFLNKSMGRTDLINSEITLDAIPKIKPSITNYVPVCLNKQGGISAPASVVKGNGSGDLTSLGLSDGFVEILPETELKSSTRYVYYAWEQN